MRIRVKIAGVGGQGVQLIGKLLSDAAFRANFNVSQAVKYEPSTSGGLTVADVTIYPEDEVIGYPFIESNPDVLLVLAQRGWDEYKGILGKDTIVLADDSNVQNVEKTEECKAVYRLPFAKTALELGSEKVMNVVALGFIAELLDIEGNHITHGLDEFHPDETSDITLLEVAPEYFEESIVDLSPARFREMNMTAFKKGYDLSMGMDVARHL